MFTCARSLRMERVGEVPHSYRDEEERWPVFGARSEQTGSRSSCKRRAVREAARVVG